MLGHGTRNIFKSGFWLEGILDEKIHVEINFNVIPCFLEDITTPLIYSVFFVVVLLKGFFYA